jgi:hypothetical protein
MTLKFKRNMTLKFKGLKEKGLLRGLCMGGLGDEHLEVEGRISELEKDPHVRSINGTMFHGRVFNIKLEKGIAREGLIKLLQEYGFPEPVSVGGTEDMECTEHPLHVFLDFRQYRIVFTYPYKPEKTFARDLKTQ